MLHDRKKLWYTCCTRTKRQIRIDGGNAEKNENNSTFAMNNKITSVQIADDVKFAYLNNSAPTTLNYGDASYDWLIMMANPQYGSMEFDIPNGTILRIPYPLNITLELYNKAVEHYNELYS